MRNKLLSLFILIAVLVSCNYQSNKTPYYSLKDSVLVKQLNSIESSNEFDTTDINYKTLKAYAANDTAFLKKMYFDIEESEKLNKQIQLIDSCIHQTKLQSLAVDEAYRFIYSAAFCPYNLNVTITKKGDSANLHLILYQYNGNTVNFRIITEFDKIITIRNWEDLVSSLNEADFWGLKKENGVTGFDGDDITVIGYKKRPYWRNNQINYVHRWSVTNTALREPYNLILKLSGIKKGCYWAE